MIKLQSNNKLISLNVPKQQDNRPEPNWRPSEDEKHKMQKNEEHRKEMP